MKKTVTHVDVQSTRDLRGPVLGLLLLGTGERISLLSREVYSVGTDSSCDVVVDDQHVSAIHCTLERRGEDLYVRDQRSKNGVWVNKSRVATSELVPGSRLRIGTTTYLVYGPGIINDDFATPSNDSFIRGEIDDYGGNAARAARGLGLHRRVVQRKKRDLALAPVAPHQAPTIFEDSIPVEVVNDDPMIPLGKKRHHAPAYGIPVVALDDDAE